MPEPITAPMISRVRSRNRRVRMRLVMGPQSDRHSKAQRAHKGLAVVVGPPGRVVLQRAGLLVALLQLVVTVVTDRLPGKQAIIFNTLVVFFADPTVVVMKALVRRIQRSLIDELVSGP